MANKTLSVAADLGKVISWPVTHVLKVIEVADQAVVAEPAVKAAIVGLLTKIEQTGADATAAVAADGLNIPADLASASAAGALIGYINTTFVPAIKAAVGPVVKAAKAPTPAAPTAKPAAAAATPETTETAVNLSEGPASS
jgi:hypothetical protein